MLKYLYAISVSRTLLIMVLAFGASYSNAAPIFIEQSVDGCSVLLPPEWTVTPADDQYIQYNSDSFAYRKNFDASYEDPVTGQRSTGSRCFKEKSYTKNPAVQDFYRSRAQQHGFMADALNLVGCAGGLKSCLIASSTYLTGSESPFLGWSGLAAGTLLLIAGLFAGSFSIAALAALGLFGAFAGYMADTSLQIANDPPDPDFTNVYQLSGDEVSVGAFDISIANEYYEGLFDSGILVAETLEGILTSMERMQGAGIGLSPDDFDRQEAQYELLASSLAESEHNLGVWIEGLPTLYGALGINDVLLDASVISETLLNIGGGNFTPEELGLIEQIGSNPTDVIARANELLNSDALVSGSAYQSIAVYGQQLQSERFPVFEVPLPQDISQVPIPATHLLFILGLAALRLARRGGT